MSFFATQGQILITNYICFFILSPSPTVQLHLRDEAGNVSHTPQHFARARDTPSEKCFF